MKESFKNWSRPSDKSRRVNCQAFASLQLYNSMIQAVAAVQIIELEYKENDSTMKQTEILSEQKLSVSSQDFQND